MIKPGINTKSAIYTLKGNFFSVKQNCNPHSLDTGLKDIPGSRVPNDFLFLDHQHFLK